MTAPFSQRLRCMFSGHDWRTAIGPRDGYFERCRTCYAARPIEDPPHYEHSTATDVAAVSDASAKSAERAA